MLHLKAWNTRYWNKIWTLIITFPNPNSSKFYIILFSPPCPCYQIKLQRLVKDNVTSLNFWPQCVKNTLWIHWHGWYYSPTIRFWALGSEHDVKLPTLLGQESGSTRFNNRTNHGETRWFPRFEISLTSFVNQ